MKCHNVCFEPEYDIIGVATDTGFSIYDLGSKTFSTCNFRPNSPKSRGESVGAKLISFIGRSNIVAVTEIRDPDQTVSFWDRDTSTKLFTGPTLPEPPLTIKMLRRFIVVGTYRRIYIISLHDMKIVEMFETSFGTGVFSVLENTIAFPSLEIGCLTVCNFLDRMTPRSTLHCFKNPVENIEISYNGHFIAVAGDEGKSILVYKFPSLELYTVIKRTRSSPIISVSFEPHGTQLSITVLGGVILKYSLLPADCDARNEENHQRSNHIFKQKIDGIDTIWVAFSIKTLKLNGMTIDGKLFHLNFDDPEIRYPEPKEVVDKTRPKI